MLMNGVKISDLFERDNDCEFRYEELNDGIRVIAYTGNKEFVIVPEEIDGKTVVEFGTCRDYSSIQPVVLLPKTICRFDPDSIGFENVEMWFSNAYMDEENPLFKVLDGILYNADMTVLCLCLNGGMKKYEMPDSVEVVLKGAFRTVSGNASWMGGLTIDNITYSKNLREIGDYAFVNLNNGSSKKLVTLPESVKHIGMYAFNRQIEVIAPGWESLGGVPCGVLRKEPFNGYSWDDKDTVLYSDDKKCLYGNMHKFSSSTGEITGVDALAFEAPTETIYPYAFDVFSRLAKLDLGPTVKKIGEKAFEKARIKTLRIPAQVEEIADDAFGFEKCNSVIVDKNNKHFMTDKIGFYRILEDGSTELICCYKSGIEEYSIIEGTVKICKNAFVWCETLRKLSLPSTLKEFDGECLHKTSVKAITIPASVNNLCNMESLDYTIEEANPVYFLEDNVLYKKDNIGLIAVEGKENARSLNIKEGTIEIAVGAFSKCESIENVTMPSSLIKIGADAFHGCGIKNLIIGSNVEYIDDGAFVSNKIEEVRLPDSLKYICRDAFYYCPVKSYTINNNANYYTENGVLMTADKKTIVAYPNGNKAKKYTIPDGVEHIGQALSGVKFSSLQIPDSVRVIGSEALDEEMSEIFFGKNLHYISENCLTKYDFQYKDKTYSLHGYPGTPIPEYAEYLKKKGSTVKLELYGMEAFASLSDEFEVMPDGDGIVITGLKVDKSEIEIPEKIGDYPVKAVSEAALLGKSIISFAFLSPETKIPFASLSGVQQYRLPDGLKEIPDFAFSRAKITSIIIPSSITRIGEQAFANNPIETITIPGSVKVVSKNMFHWCKRLKSVKFEEGIERLEEGVFSSCDSLKKVYIPASVSFISDSVFGTGVFTTHYPNTIFVTVPGSYADQFLREKEYNRFGTKYHLKVTSAEEAEFEDGAGTYNSFDVKLNAEGLATVIFKKNVESDEPDVIVPEEIGGKAVSEICFDTLRSSLETITIPKTVKKVSLTSKSFLYNPTLSLKSVIVAEDSQYLMSDEKALFSKDGKQLIHIFAYDIEEYIVPDGVETICESAFMWQKNLKKIVLPDSMTTIETAAFSECQNLKEIVGADKVKNVAPDAYNNTPYLSEQDYILLDGVLKKYVTEETEIIIPDGVTAIDDSAFESDQQTIVKIVLPSTMITVGKSLTHLSKLETVVIENGVEDLTEWSFEKTGSSSRSRFSWSANKIEPIKEIFIPASVKKMPKGSFSVSERIIVDSENETFTSIDGVLYLKNLSTLLIVPKSFNSPVFTVPEGVQVIGSHAFQSNTNVQEVLLPSTITSIEYGAFSDCSNLSKINLEKVKEIDNHAFSDCAKLVTVELNSERIGSWAFQNCRLLTTVELHNTKEIAWGAFENCGITTVDLPETLETIGEKAFARCPIRSITAPKSVKSIDEKAFAGIPDIRIYDSLETVSGEMGITDTQYKEAFAPHMITVLSAETGEVKYVVPMYTDGTYDMEKILTRSWSDGAKFDFNALDSYFGKIKDTDIKIQIAIKRLIYPYELLDAFKDAYSAYLNRNAKVVVKQFIDKGDIDTCVACQEYGLIKKNNIDELIAYAADKKATAFSAYLIDYKEKNIKAGKTINRDSLSLGSVKVVDPWQISKLSESLLGRYRGSETEITLPTEVNGKKISGVANNDTKVPDNYKQLVSITIPEGYKTIGQNAFYGCKKLERIVIPATVEEIGVGAFANCSSLKEINLPNSVTKIGERCFKGCSNLATVKLPIGLERLESETFNGCSMLARIDIPRTVRSINDKCFANSGITHVILHTRYIWIDSDAFEKGVAFRAYPGAIEGKNIQLMSLADNPSDTMISVTIRFDNQAEKTLGMFAKETRKTFTKKDSKELTDKFSSFTAGNDLLNWISDVYGNTLTSTDEYQKDSAFIAEIKDFSEVCSILVKEEKKNDDGDTTAVFTYNCATCSGDVKRSGKYATEKIIRYYKHFYTDDEEEFPTTDNSKNSPFVLTPIKSIDFEGKIFVLTGFSEEDTQAYTKIITDKGGIVKSSVVLATDYLLVNEAYGSETTKYKKAIELNGSNHHIAIINSRMLIKYAKA